MIIVDANKVELGITKTMMEKVPLAGVIYALNSELAIENTVAVDLAVLFRTLMKKYGATKAIDMIQSVIELATGDYENLNKNKGDN